MEKRIFIRCEDHDIPAVIRYPEDGQDRYPAVLLLHGFTELSCLLLTGYSFGNI